MSGEANGNWTDERVETLKRLWADGFSASQIAAQLGGVSRNGVISKVHRIGLPGRGKTVSFSVPRPPKKRPNCFAGINERRRVAKAERERALAEKLPPSSPPPPGVKRVALLDLQPGMCRWPLGDPREPDFAFCGCPVTHVERHRGRIAVEEPAPYCPYHQRAAHESGAQAARRERREDAAPPRLRANGIKGHGQWSL